MEMSRVDIDTVEEMLMQEGVIAVPAVAWQPNEFVEAEKPNLREIETRRTVQIHQVPVQSERRVARSESEPQRGSLLDRLGNKASSYPAAFLLCFADEHQHHSSEEKDSLIDASWSIRSYSCTYSFAMRSAVKRSSKVLRHRRRSISSTRRTACTISCSSRQRNPVASWSMSS